MNESQNSFSSEKQQQQLNTSQVHSNSSRKNSVIQIQQPQNITAENDNLKNIIENPEIYAERLFEQKSVRQIQNYVKDVQKQIIGKNNELKQIFSNKYLDLLNCSDLISKIADYSANISDASAKPKETFQTLFQEVLVNNNNNTQPQQFQSQNQNINENNEKSEISLKSLDNQVFSIIQKASVILEQNIFSIPMLITQDIIQQIDKFEVNKENKYEIQECKQYLNEFMYEIFNSAIEHISDETKISLDKEKLSKQQSNCNNQTLNQKNDIIITIFLFLSIQHFYGKKEHIKLTVLKEYKTLYQNAYKIDLKKNSNNFVFFEPSFENSKNIQNNSVFQLLKISFNLFFEISLAQLLEKSDINSFLRFFGDFYGAVNLCQNQENFSQFLNFANIGVQCITGEKPQNYGDLLQIKNNDRYQQFYLNQSLNNNEQNIIQSEEILQKISNNMRYSMLGLTHMIYQQQFKEMESVIRKIMIQKKDIEKENPLTINSNKKKQQQQEKDIAEQIYFNHSFYQHMLFEEKNIKMIENFQKILFEIEIEQEQNNINKNSENENNEIQKNKININIRQTLQTLWKEFYISQIDAYIYKIQIPKIQTDFQNIFLQRVLKQQKKLQNEYIKCNWNNILSDLTEKLGKEIVILNEKCEELFSIEDYYKEAYLFEEMKDYFSKKVVEQLQQIENGYQRILKSQISKQKFQFQAVFLHNILLENILEQLKNISIFQKTVTNFEKSYFDFQNIQNIAQKELKAIVQTYVLDIQQKQNSQKKINKGSKTLDKLLKQLNNFFGQFAGKKIFVNLSKMKNLLQILEEQLKQNNDAENNEIDLEIFQTIFSSQEQEKNLEKEYQYYHFLCQDILLYLEKALVISQKQSIKLSNYNHFQKAQETINFYAIPEDLNNFFIMPQKCVKNNTKNLNGILKQQQQSQQQQYLQQQQQQQQQKNPNYQQNNNSNNNQTIQQQVQYFQQQVQWEKKKEKIGQETEQIKEKAKLLVNEVSGKLSAYKSFQDIKGKTNAFSKMLGQFNTKNNNNN